MWWNGGSTACTHIWHDQKKKKTQRKSKKEPKKCWGEKATEFEMWVNLQPLHSFSFSVSDSTIAVFLVLKITINKAWEQKPKFLLWLVSHSQQKDIFSPSLHFSINFVFRIFFLYLLYWILRPTIVPVLFLLWPFHIYILNVYLRICKLKSVVVCL